MCKLFLLPAAAALAASLAFPAHAQQPAAPSATPDDRGFSFFLGIARQQAKHAESSQFLPVESTVTVTSPMLLSGALYVVSDNLLFSIVNETTAYPDVGKESWYSTAPVFNNVVLTDRLLQTNSFTLSQSNTDILVHYRMKGPWFVVAGPTIRSLSFTRYAFRIGPDNAVSTPATTTVEETVGEAIFNLGVAFESERVRGAAQHYGLRATVGLPVYRRVRNTNLPDVEFTSAKGFDAGIEGRYSFAITKDFHLGLWGKWSLVDREAERIGNAEVPDNRLENKSIGLELLWKL